MPRSFAFSLGGQADAGLDTGAMAYGEGMEGSESDYSVLHPLHPFGLAFWVGVASVAGLVLVSRSLS